MRSWDPEMDLLRPDAKEAPPDESAHQVNLVLLLAGSTEHPSTEPDSIRTTTAGWHITT